jgi:hypothetical protein
LQDGLVRQKAWVLTTSGRLYTIVMIISVYRSNPGTLTILYWCPAFKKPVFFRFCKSILILTQSNPMAKYLPLPLAFVMVLMSCSSGTRKVNSSTNNVTGNEIMVVQPDLSAGQTPKSLSELSRTEDGAYVLEPGFYEAEFKTYCLQPGTPDPTPRDAYLQAPLYGHRKDIIESILVNSRKESHLEQRNIQLLLWGVVSGTEFNKLPSRVQYTATQLLSPKQLFELKGGVMGVIKQYSSAIPGASSMTVHKDMQRLFNLSNSSYEFFEQVAVLRQPSQVTRPNYQKDQWVKQEGEYYVRYFPASYQKVKIQVYVPDSSIDSTGKQNGEYVVFDPTGMLAVPANSNAQRLGVGAPVVDIIKAIIKIEQRKKQSPKKQPEPPKPVKGGVS